MSIFTRILCPTDFSDNSSKALDQAAILARRFDSELVALHVTEPIRSALPTREDLQTDLSGLLDAARQRGVRTRAVVEEGKPADGILRYMKEVPTDLVVMGTHGRRGFDRFFIGSVTEQVMRTALCPVLTLSPGTSRLLPPDVSPFRTILCAVDFSTPSNSARDLAFALARETEARLIQTHVVEILPEWESRELAHFNVPEFARYLEHDAVAALRNAIPTAAARGVRCEEMVGRGKAWREILRLAEQERADLIVMGMQGGGRLDQLLFGSTTLHVVRGAHCPVLTTR